MPSANRPWWQQATALVSLGAGGAITGFSFVPQPAAELTSPSSMPIGLTALQQSARPTQVGSGALRSAIVNVASYYLRMAESKSPAEMEAIIWQRDSIDGADHGESCAAFASLTLELGAHVVGKQSWVTGGSSYPWPLHRWADVRVNTNPASPEVTSIVQDAQAHQRWHPMGDGYVPEPGDWVVFDGHVEVVTKYAGGVLHTIGGDSVPNFSVNAHEYGDPLSAQGVVGFVDNGDLPATTADAAPAGAAASDAAPGSGALSAGTTAIPGTLAAAAPGDHPGPATAGAAAAGAAIPGMLAALAPSQGGHAGQAGQAGDPAHSGQAKRQTHPADRPPPRRSQAHAAAAPAGSGAGVPGAYVPGAGAWASAPMADTAPIPGLPMMAHRLSGHAAARPSPAYRRHSPGQGALPGRGTSAQQAFIGAVAPAAVATQRKYGVPASVTIAQAIDESGWGQSNLAVNEHNLFGIKGTGPAGSYQQQTQEYENGQLVTTTSSFRVYRTTAESIDDHGRLLATSGYYRRAMAARANPNAFAASLTGIYATDPEYGTKLIRLMKQYDLYRYDSIASAPAARTAGSPTARPAAAAPGAASHATAGPAPAGSPARRSTAPAGLRPGSAAPATAATLAPIPGADMPATAGPGAATPPARAPRTPGAAKPGPRMTGARAGSSATAAPGPRAGSGPATADGRPRGAAQARATAPAAAPATAARSGAGQGTAGTTRRAGGRPPADGAAPARTRRPAPAPPGASGAGPAAPASNAGTPGAASIPGVAAPGAAGPAKTSAASPPRATSRPAAASGSATGRPKAAASTQAVSARLLAAEVSSGPRRSAPLPARAPAARYRPQIPPAVRSAYVTRAKEPLYQSEQLYRDVADHSGVGWQLLAACDWMQCRAGERYSPVHGEKLGTLNADGSCYRTRSEALAQCADELAALAWTVYGIDMAARRHLSVRDLASVFAAFRWGGLLRRHRTSAMEFPYSVAGLTAQHVKMRWPDIDEPKAPDRPGGRFRMPFGAVPVVLFLNYPATV